MIGTARSATQAGATRTCPHCRATILESAIVCPGCKHHLRFDKDMRPGGVPVTKTAWQVEGTLDAERMDAATEYSILVVVRNERNEEVARQVVNVGSLQGVERRTFALSIETSEPKPMPPLPSLRRR
jgi:Zn finger protein HypA/HybF involved in hydrogenase expression